MWVKRLLRERSVVMVQRWAAIILLLGVGTSFMRTVGAAGVQFLSANGKYSVELSRTPEKQVLITVFKVSTDGKVFQWSRPVDWVERYPSGSRSVSEVKALVTNDGKVVVLRDREVPHPNVAVRICGRSQEEEHRVSVFDHIELTRGEPVPEPPGMRHNTGYMYLSAVLDFIFDEEKSYAVWFGQTDRWALISLKTFKLRVVDDPEKIARLNRIAYRTAQELVAQHQPAPLQRMFTALQEEVSKIYPSLKRSKRPRFMSAETSAAYLFLTARRNGGDRAYLEGLVHFPYEGIQSGMMGGTGEQWEINFLMRSGERLVGDYLLSRWNGETNRESVAREMHLLLPQDSTRYLGTMKVELELPMPVPRTDPGVLRIYLIPARIPVGQWSTSSEVIQFNTALQGAFVIERSSKGKATFRLLTPGEYRMKVIWERHRTAGGGSRSNIYTALPGDYESAESPVIRVEAGEVVEGISMVCTNRVGTAAEYQEDDQQLEGKGK